MTGNVSSIEPQSVAADQEPERKVRTFRVLKYNDRFADDSGCASWDECEKPYETVWTPDAKEVGQAYGEGDYLLIESTDSGSPEWAYGMRIVADRVYRLADDETPA